MVDAVLKDLPKAWNGVVVMDWSDGSIARLLILSKTEVVFRNPRRDLSPASFGRLSSQRPRRRFLPLA